MTVSLSSYKPCADLWCITTYFNPCHYRTRQENYARFKSPIREAGIPLLTVECAFGDDPFELPPGPDVIQVRSPHVLWQKERLINLAVSRLPEHARKVVWLDGDILFTNPGWAVQSAAMLDDFPIIQPFAERKKLLSDMIRYDEKEGSLKSFAYLRSVDPSLVFRGSYLAHGSTGFAWAAQRDILAEHGLYEAFLSGVGDHQMAHAMCGDLTSPCVRSCFDGSLVDRVSPQSLLRRVIKKCLPASLRKQIHRLPAIRNTNHDLQLHFEAWGRRLYQTVQGRIGHVPGMLLHLWHGDSTDRAYSLRNRELQRLGFDPVTDLYIGPSGCLEWASDKPELHRWAAEFFARRKEDGG